MFALLQLEFAAAHPESTGSTCFNGPCARAPQCHMLVGGEGTRCVHGPWSSLCSSDGPSVLTKEPQAICIGAWGTRSLSCFIFQDGYSFVVETGGKLRAGQRESTARGCSVHCRVYSADTLFLLLCPTSMFSSPPLCPAASLSCVVCPRLGGLQHSALSWRETGRGPAPPRQPAQRSTQPLCQPEWQLR